MLIGNQSVHSPLNMGTQTPYSLSTPWYFDSPFIRSTDNSMRGVINSPRFLQSEYLARMV